MRRIIDGVGVTEWSRYLIYHNDLIKKIDNSNDIYTLEMDLWLCYDFDFFEEVTSNLTKMMIETELGLTP